MKLADRDWFQAGERTGERPMGAPSVQMWDVSADAADSRAAYISTIFTLPSSGVVWVAAAFSILAA